MKSPARTLITAALLSLAATAARSEELAPLFPFVISYDAPDNASSVAHLLDAPAKAKCFALDPSGNRKQPVPVSASNQGGAQLVLKPEYQTVWYEIEIAP